MKDTFHPISPEQMTRLYGSDNSAEVPSCWDIQLPYLAANDDVPEPYVEEFSPRTKLALVITLAILAWGALALVVFRII